MTRRLLPLALATAVASVVASGVAPALAGEGLCAAMAVAADARVRARWPELPDRIRRAFEARLDVDSCARVRITKPARGLAVQVVLPDGRSASRRVARAGDVVAALQALLLVPEPPAPAVEALPTPAGLPPPVPAEAPRSALHAPALEVVARSVPAAPAPAPATATATTGKSPPPASLAAASREAGEPAPGGVGVELSALAGTRAGDGKAGVGLGLLTLVDLGGWLVGAACRADHYEALDGGPPGGALVLAALGGRRFRSGTLALDLTAGPALALLGTVTSVVQVGPAMGGQRIARESRSLGAAGRLLAGVRLSFRARSVLRPFVGVDAELGTTRVPADPPEEVGRLPIWAAGLLLGATVGSR